MERLMSIHVKIFADRTEMGAAAAADVAEAMKGAAAERDTVTMCFAAAPSQDDFLEALTATPDLPWDKVVAFHLDEYIDLPRGHKNSFEVYLNDYLFNAVSPGTTHFIADMPGAPKEKCRRYAQLLQEAGGIDIACIGIGENGHIAFNEPGSDFSTEDLNEVIELDDTSVRQQYRDYKDDPDPDKRYASLDDVPRTAITMTVPAICASRQVFCIVPAEQKADAVKAALEGPIGNQCPATALRTHPATTIYLDRDSARSLTRRIGS